MKQPQFATLQLERMVGGGQTLGQLESGKKAFVWGGLPGETVTIRITKKKNSFVEGVVTEVHNTSPNRIAPKDPASFLSTSPWQIMDFGSEQQHKAALINEAFALHQLTLPHETQIKTDRKQYGYRNKVEVSFWWSNDTQQIGLAFFQRGGKGKIPVSGTSLAMPEINQAAQAILALIRSTNIEARNLKTLLIRASQAGEISAQLYIKDKSAANELPVSKLAELNLHGVEVIHSDYRSPASVITERLQSVGDSTLTDEVLGVPFNYATEGFFQVNIPMYEMALRDMATYILPNTPVIDMYSGVGSIGLTIGGDSPTLVEINDAAVSEMRKNAKNIGKNAQIVHASSETALEYIQSEATIIVDPPRAGLHEKVVDELLQKVPPRIIYLSCNPVTQARDIMRLQKKYRILAHTGYNFFPRTPHIEHLVVLERQ